MESEPNQQPNDNSTRQADSIGSEELDAAISAAVQRANHVHSLEPSADDSDDYVDAGFDMVLIDPLTLEPLNPYPWEEPLALTGDITSAGEPYYGDENADLSSQASIYPSVEEEILPPFGAGSNYVLSGMIIPSSYYEDEDNYENQDLSPQAPISSPVEAVKLSQPAADDAVLGGQNQALVSDAVLGGIEGVKRRLASTVVEQRIAALKDALKYNQAGLNLVISALNNESKSVAQAAYFLLRDSSDLIAQQALQEYNPYRFFQCTFYGKFSNNREAPIAITPDSQTLVCGNRDGSITLWNLHTGKRLRTIRGHSNSISCIAISQDGQTLVSGSQDKSIKIWNLHTGEEISTLKGHSKQILSLAISPDSQTLVSGSQEGSIKIWNLQTGKERSALKGNSRFVSSIAISPDSLTLVVGGDEKIKIWNLQTCKERSSFKARYDYGSSVVISPDGETLVSSNGRTIKLWNLATGEHLSIIKEYSGGINAIAISPDSQTLISGSTEGTINFWNLNTGKQLHTLKVHSNPVTSVAISPDGQTLVSTSNCGTIKVWGLR